MNRFKITISGNGQCKYSLQRKLSDLTIKEFENLDILDYKFSRLPGMKDNQILQIWVVHSGLRNWPSNKYREIYEDIDLAIFAFSLDQYHEFQSIHHWIEEMKDNSEMLPQIHLFGCSNLPTERIIIPADIANYQIELSSWANKRINYSESVDELITVIMDSLSRSN